MRGAQKMRLHFPSVRCAEVPTSAQLSSESAQCVGTQNSRSVPRSCKFSAQKFAKSFNANILRFMTRNVLQLQPATLRRVQNRATGNVYVRRALDGRKITRSAVHLRKICVDNIRIGCSIFFDFGGEIGARRARDASDFTCFVLRKALVVGAAPV